MSYRLGIDVGGTKVNLVLTHADGTLIARRRLDVPAHAACRALMREIAVAAQELLACAHVPLDALLALGMGIPGTTDGQNVLNAPNLHWRDEPCAAYFAEVFGRTPRLMQDTRAAAWGEYCLGAARGRRCVVSVTLGTGVGCGVVLDGKIYHGALGTAGEIGHIPVVPGGRACNCGRLGCMEAYASGTGLARTLKERALAHIPDTHALFDAAAQGDLQAKAILDEAVGYAAQALCALVNLLSPDALIFSGGLSAQHALYVQPLMDAIRRGAYPLAADERLLMAVSALGEDAPALGAAML